MKIGHKTLLMLAVAGALVTACKEYMDDLSAIGKRVEVLEQDEDKGVAQLNSIVETLKDLVKNLDNLGGYYFTDIQENPNGVYEFFLACNPDHSLTVTQGTVGEKGEKGKDVVIDKYRGDDGVWYWIIDEQKTNIPIVATDGEDINLSDLPWVRINNVDSCWQIYNGSTGEWEYITALGEDGVYHNVFAKGKDGEDDPQFEYVNILRDEYNNIYAIELKLRNGPTYIFYTTGLASDKS